MPRSDLQYLRRRAGDEATNAIMAASPRAAELHAQLAEGYAREIAKLEAADKGEDPAAKFARQ